MKLKGKSESAEILEIVNFIKDRMMTRDEANEHFIEINGRLLSIEQELKDIKRHLNTLEKRLDGVEEYASDIKELRSRVTAIERSLKMQRS